MSGFSPELIDYLEGKISFEEFERRREERKTREKKVSRWARVLFGLIFPKQQRAGLRVGGGLPQLLSPLETPVFTPTPELSASQDTPPPKKSANLPRVNSTAAQ